MTNENMKPTWYAIPIDSEGYHIGDDRYGEKVWVYDWRRYSGRTAKAAFLNAVMATLDQAETRRLPFNPEVWEFDCTDTMKWWAVVPVYSDAYPILRFEIFDHFDGTDAVSNSYRAGEFDLETHSEPLSWDVYTFTPNGEKAYGNLVTFHANSEV